MNPSQSNTIPSVAYPTTCHNGGSLPCPTEQTRLVAHRQPLLGRAPRTQNNLGLVLWDQGIRTGGEVGTGLLAAAAQAYREALTVQTKEQLPQDWARTQNNMGATLSDQGTRTGGEAGKVLIREAIKAYGLALQIQTREALPVQWELTMNNLEIVKKALQDMK